MNGKYGRQFTGYSMDAALGIDAEHTTQNEFTMTIKYNIAFGWICIPMLVLISCTNSNPLKNNAGKPDDMINLNQDVTVNTKPKDSIFIHFEKNWMNFINKDPNLLQTVVSAEKNTEFKPLTSTDCVFSEGAGAFMPRINISWTEQDNGDENIRYDVSLVYKGFERNMYTTVYPVQNQQRFKMPGNSNFIQDTTALFLTGATLFPKLVSLKKELINDQNLTKNTPTQQNDSKNRRLMRHNLVLEDLGPGISYTLRKCRFSGENWTETFSLIFTTPVCPQKF